MQKNEADTERLTSPTPPFRTGFPSLTKPERSLPFSQQLSCTQPNESNRNPQTPSALRYILNIITTALIYARAFNVASVLQEGISCIHFLNSALRAEAHRGSRDTAPIILNLGIR